MIVNGVDKDGVPLIVNCNNHALAYKGYAEPNFVFVCDGCGIHKKYLLGSMPSDLLNQIPHEDLDRYGYALGG